MAFCARSVGIGAYPASLANDWPSERMKFKNAFIALPLSVLVQFLYTRIQVGDVIGYAPSPDESSGLYVRFDSTVAPFTASAAPSSVGATNLPALFLISAVCSSEPLESARST